jgi:hypothetical protein
MANIQRDAQDTYTREAIMRVREEEAKKWRARSAARSAAKSAAKSAASSKRKRLRP